MDELLKVRPRVAIALFTDGVPWYPYRTTLAGQLHYTTAAELPNPSATWSRLYRGDMRLHIDLEDESTLAELICCTRDPERTYRMINPDLIQPGVLMHQLYRALVECRCNPQVLTGQVVDQIGDGLDPRIAPRMSRCRVKAKYLLSDAVRLHPVGGGDVG